MRKKTITFLIFIILLAFAVPVMAGTYTVKWVGVKSVNDTLHLNFVSTVSNATISIKSAPAKYIDVFPLTSATTEWANYEIKIDGSNITIYNVTGAVKATFVDTNFWTYVNSTGADIRIYNQSSPLYFWIESFNYTGQTADIWVNLTAGSTELNLVYGDPLALSSSYNNGTMVFKFFDNFNTLDKWRIVRVGGTGYAKVEDGYLKLYSTDSRTAVDTPVILQNVVIKCKVKVVSNAQDFIIVASNGNYDSSGNEINGYDVNWNGWPTYPDRQRLRKFVDDVSTILATTTGGLLQNGNVYILSFMFVSPTLKQINDGTVILEAQDSSFENLNYLGLAVWSSAEYWVDWIFVAKLADPASFETPYQATAANVTIGTYNIQVVGNGTPVSIPSTAFTTDTPINITYHIPFNATLTFSYAYSSTATITDTGTVIEKNFSINTTGLTTNVVLNMTFPLRTKDYTLHLKLNPSATVTNTTTNTSIITTVTLLNNTTYTLDETVGYLVANITGVDELSNSHLTSITVNYTSSTGLATKSGSSVKLYGTDFPRQQTEEVIDFSSTGYSRRHYILDCTALNQSIKLYLLQDSASTMITYTVVCGTSTLDHAKVEIYKYIGDSWKLIDSQYSDSSGVVAVPLHAFDTYKVVASKPGYVTITTTITISQATYTIKLGGVSLAIPASTRTVIIFKPSASTLQPGTNTITVSVVPQGKTVTSATMTVYANNTPVATVTKTDITSPTDLTATVNLNESTPVSVKVSYIVDGQTITETKNYTVPQATGIWATFLVLNGQLKQTKGGNLIGLLIAAFIALAVVATLAATTNTTARGLGIIAMLIFTIVALPLNAISINLLVVIWVSVVASWILWRMI